MPFVNLIQEQRLEAQARERTLKTGLSVTMAIGVICLCSTGFFMFDSIRLNLLAGSLEQKKAQLEPMMKELEANKTELSKLEPRLQTLTSATTFSKSWNRILEHLATNTPDEAWLSAVKTFQSDPKTPIEVTFNGVSTTQETVGQFMLNLQASEDLENVNLKYTQPKMVEGGKQQFEFEITASIKGSGQAEDEDAPKEDQSA